jgi:hypothetical protein
MLAIDIAEYRKIRAELRVLEIVLADRGKRDRRSALNVNALILEWESFSGSFGSDDRLMVEDCVAALLLRNRLEALLTRASPGTRAYLETLMAPGDDAYRSATIEDGEGFGVFVLRDSEGWWWHRRPAHLRGALRRAFEQAQADRREGRCGLRTR